MKEKFKRIYKSEYLIIALWLCVAAMFMGNSPLHPWKGYDVSEDSAACKVISVMMERGYVPYKDYFSDRGPLLYVWNYIGNKISAYKGVWILELLNLWITVCLLYKIARMRCGSVCSIISVLTGVSLLFSYFQGGNYAEEFVMPFLAALVYLGCNYFRNEGHRWSGTFVYGGCLGCVFLFCWDAALLYAFFTSVIYIKKIRKSDCKLTRKQWGLFFAGLGIPLLVTTLWLIGKGAFTSFIYSYFMVGPRSMTASASVIWETFFVLLNHPVVILTMFVLGFFCCKKDRLVYGIYFLWILFGIFWAGLYGGSHLHRGMVLIPMMILPLSMLFEICGEHPFLKQGLGLYLLVAVVISDWLIQIQGFAFMFSDRNTDHISASVRNATAFLEAYSQERDEIAVYGDWSIIYLMSEREPASAYFYTSVIESMPPEVKINYFNALAESHPKAIIVAEGKGDEWIEEFLDQNGYTPKWADENGDYGKAAAIYGRD